MSSREAAPASSMPGTRTPMAVRAAWCCGTWTRPNGRAATTWLPPCDQMEVMYAGTSQEGYLPPISYNELVEAGIDLDMHDSHEVTLADGSKHTARPVWSYLEESVADCTPEWCAEITGLDPALVEEACVVWATPSRGTDLRQRWHPPAARPRPDRQLHAVGARHPAPHVHDRELRRACRQPRSYTLAPRRASHGRSRLQHAPRGEGAAHLAGRHPRGGCRARIP